MVRGPPRKRRRSSVIDTSCPLTGGSHSIDDPNLSFFNSCQFVRSEHDSLADLAERRMELAHAGSLSYEDEVAALGNRLSLSAARKYGIGAEFIQLWASGVRLIDPGRH